MPTNPKITVMPNSDGITITLEPVLVESFYKEMEFKFSDELFGCQTKKWKEPIVKLETMAHTDFLVQIRIKSSNATLIDEVIKFIVVYGQSNKRTVINDYIIYPSNVAKNFETTIDKLKQEIDSIKNDLSLIDCEDGANLSC